MSVYEAIKDIAELLSYIATPLLAYFAWKMLGQLKIGGLQVKAAVDQILIAKKISQIQSKREAIKIATEQSVLFAEKIIPEINKFIQLKNQNKYPILSKAVVVEDWPNIQCKTDNLPGLLKEIESNNGLVPKTLNQLEGLAMFFCCGVADANTAYRPLSASFCGYIKNFLPFIIISHEHGKQFSNILTLYGAWEMRNQAEKAEKEISKHKSHLSKIKVPELKAFGTENNC